MNDSIRVAVAEDSAILRDGLVQLLADRGFEITDAVSGPGGAASAVGGTGPTWPSSTSACPRRSRTRGCGRRSACASGTRSSASCSSPSTSRPATPPSCWPTMPPAWAICSRTVSPTSVTSWRRWCESPRAGPRSTRRSSASCRAASAPIDSLSRAQRPRERQVLSLMAEGRSNAAIASTLVISAGVVEKHVANIFTKLDLPVSQSDHRRVLAVLRLPGFLNGALDPEANSARGCLRSFRSSSSSRSSSGPRSRSPGSSLIAIMCRYPAAFQVLMERTSRVG